MRWPTATGLWLALPVWAYAVLAVLELRDLGYDPTDPDPGYVPVPDLAPPLVWATAIGLGLALLVALGSLVTGRARRVADLLLGLGMGLGGWMWWLVAQPRPVAPLLVGLAGALLVLSALLPAPRETGRFLGWLGRLLLATVALLAGQVLLHELADHHYQLRSWTYGYWAGLGLCLAFLVAAVLGPRLTHPVLRWLFGLPLLLLGVVAVLGGLAGLHEGYLVSGYEENEDGWRLGGPVLFAGTGWCAAGLAALRGRWLFGVTTAGLAVVVVLAVLFGIPEIRSGY